MLGFPIFYILLHTKTLFEDIDFCPKKLSLPQKKKLQQFVDYLKNTSSHFNIKVYMRKATILLFYIALDIFV